MSTVDSNNDFVSHAASVKGSGLHQMLLMGSCGVVLHVGTACNSGAQLTTDAVLQWVYQSHSCFHQLTMHSTFPVAIAASAPQSSHDDLVDKE